MGGAHRAAAYLCVRDNEAAAADSERSIALDETYPKGHSRLGYASAPLSVRAKSFKSHVRPPLCPISTARLALGQFAEAAKALKRALELEPDNERTRQELQKAEERLAPSSSSASSGQSVTPAAQPTPGAGAGPRGMPSMGGGGGGMPDFASLLSNPAMMQMANPKMSSGMLSELMSNPMMANMYERRPPPRPTRNLCPDAWRARERVLGGQGGEHDGWRRRWRCARPGQHLERVRLPSSALVGPYTDANVDHQGRHHTFEMQGTGVCGVEPGRGGPDAVDAR